MENFSIAFAPELPVWLITILCVAIASLCLFGLATKIRGSLVRTIAGILVGLALFNPSLLREDRSELSTIVPLIVDETTSQKLNNRDTTTANAVDEIRAQFERLNGFELREVSVSDRISETSDVSSALFAALDTSLQDVPPDRVGGAIFVTDGQVHDVPKPGDGSTFKPPLHVMLTGKKGEKDRRIVLKNAPRFGVVDEQQEILYEIEETGFDTAGPVEVTVSLDGEVVTIDEVLPGEESSFIFDVPHGGKNIIELSAAVADGEITETNNRTFTTLNGIRENLRVLLVSGEPHAGERTWRNLLKSDASVDLVHFTILRPPEKQDGTPINQLSLIAFPTRELFIQKIDEFDLIIFDRYKRRGVLPVLYFDNIARYVQNGGAVLVAAGPEYAQTTSIGQTPLNQVLPALASGEVQERPFKPQLSELGQRHPVTRELDGWNDGEPEWSRWFRSVDVGTPQGETVMVDDAENPLLVLQRHNEGRVALFLSDHVWLWSRGFEGGGPHVQLLRRLAHWLMKEPELEEERLTAETVGEDLIISRQSIEETPPKARVVSPSGDEIELELTETDTGRWTASYRTAEIGLYRVANGDLSALAQVGPANPRELASVVSTPEILAPVVDARDGSITRIEADGIPRFVSVSETGTRSGRGWAGVVDRSASVLNGINRIPLFTGLLGLALLLLAFAATWYREGR